MQSLFLKIYTTSILIRADRQAIWQVLADFSGYHRWNSFTVAIESDCKVGFRVLLTVQMKPGHKPILQTEYIRNFAPESAMEWGMNWGPFLRAHRVQHLIVREAGTTEYFTEDIIKGWLCPLVHLLYGKYIQAGFDRMAFELKKSVEKP